MARKVYFYNAEFDEAEGTSKVTLMTPQGMFSGTAKVNKDEDERHIKSHTYDSTGYVQWYSKSKQR